MSLVTNAQQEISNKENELNVNQLDQLPPELIGRCGSFLPPRDLHQLSCTSRTINEISIHRSSVILNLQKPIAMRELDFRDYPHVQRVILNSMNFNDSPVNIGRVFGNISEMKSLRALEIRIVSTDDLEEEERDLIFWSLRFLSNCKKLVNRIDELHLKIFDFDEPESLIELLRAFRNVHFLSIHCRNSDYKLPIDNLQFTFPKLIGLTILGDFDAGVGSAIIGAITSRLQHLSLRYFSWSNVISDLRN